MKERKKSKNWYIALRHCITSGIMSTLMVYIVYVILFALVGRDSLSSLIQFPLIVFLFMGGFFGRWLGIVYSANYIKKHYIVENKDKIINLATIYVVVLSIIGILYVIFASKEKGYEMTGVTTLCFLIAVIIDVVLVYTLSKRYIQNTQAIENSIK